MHLALIRHGQTPSNLLGLLDTAVPGPGLTDLGTEQAAALPAALSGQRIDVLYASPQVRAQLTAAPLAAERGLSVVIRDGLREIEAVDEIEQQTHAIAGPDGGAAIVAHGAILRFWASVRAGNVRDTYGMRRPLHNTGVVTLEGGSVAGWTALTWTGTAVGGPALDDGLADGPAGGDSILRRN